MKNAVAILLAIMVVFMPSSVLAMQFSQPVILGYIATKGGPYSASINAWPSSVEDTYYDFGRDDQDRIRLYVRQRLFGSTDDVNNTVKYWGGMWVYVYEIKSDSGVVVYIVDGQGSDGVFGIDIIGKNKSGKFIKYIGSGLTGSEGFTKYHNESEFYGAIGNKFKMHVEGDTVILDCGVYQGGTRPVEKDWQYRLKWDEAAQSFGIEYRDL